MGSLMFYRTRGGTPSSDSLSRVPSSTHASRRKGAGGILAVLGVAAAVAVIIFPLARWHASLSNSAAGLNDGLSNTSTRLEMVSAMEDRWHQINDMDVAEFKNLTSDKETKYGKFTVKESFGAVGKYNASTGKCDDGTPGTGDRACRVATLTVTNEDGTATLGPVQAVRVATSDDRLRNLEAKSTELDSRVTTAQNTADTAKTNAATAQSSANSALSQFGNYYTKSETYKKSEVDSKVSSGSGYSGSISTLSRDGVHHLYFSGGRLIRDNYSDSW